MNKTLHRQRAGFEPQRAWSFRNRLKATQISRKSSPSLNADPSLCATLYTICGFCDLYQRRSTFMLSFRCADHHPIWIGDERGRLVSASPMMTKETLKGPSWRENNRPENGLVKPPRRDSSDSPAQPSCSEKKRQVKSSYYSPLSKEPSPSQVRQFAPLRLVAQNKRPHAPLAPIGSTLAYFFFKWEMQD